MEEETAKKTTLTENKSENAEKEPKSTNAEADEKNSRPKISLLKLKSMNGINTAMEGVSVNWNIFNFFIFGSKNVNKRGYSDK